MKPVFLCVLGLLSGLHSCTSKSPCDSLVPEYCGLPFPNSYFTVPSADTNTGVRVNFTADVFPSNTLGVPLSPKEWNKFDGFSPFPSILTYFANLSDANLPPHWDLAQSLLSSSHSILLHAQTGELVAHFGELDSNTTLPDTKRCLMIWPSQRLEDNSRYIVALRGLKTTQGKLIEPSETFRLLRDDIATRDPNVETRRPHFEDIFNHLDGIGVERQSLQIAWDFTTASLDFLTKRLLFARDDALHRIGEGPSYVINEVYDNLNEHVHRRIRGIMSVPLYLNSPFPGGNLVVDEKTDLPLYQGLVPVQFTVIIPPSVANLSQTPPLLLQYGHGLFGSQQEVETGYLEAQADAHGYILFASDWWGMAQYDVPAILYAINFAPDDFNIIPDRLTQGVVNAHVLMRLLKTKLSRDPVLTLNGSIKIDPQLSHYYGNSLGGVVGEVYMATTIDVERGVLGVAGGPFPLLLPRSKDFTRFELDVRLLYPDPVDYMLTFALWGMIWARLDPNAYMSSITKNPLKNTPTHQVLYHYALGDSQVNVIGLYAIARSAGAVMFESNVHCQYSFADGSGMVTDTLFGFEKVPDDAVLTKDSVAMGFDCGVPPEPRGNHPPNPAYDTHERPRRNPLAQQQMDSFLRSGTIKNVCNGPCKC